MQKHKKLLLIFVLSICGLHYFSGEVSKLEYAYEHRQIDSQTPIMAEMSFVTAFLLLGTISIVELSDYVQSYVDKLHNNMQEVC